MEVVRINASDDLSVFPVGHSVIVLALGSATGHHSLSKLCFFTNQVLALLDLLRFCKESTACKHDVYFLPNQLHEKVTSLHLPELRAALTVLAQERAVHTCAHTLDDTAISMLPAVTSLGRCLRRFSSSCAGKIDVEIENIVSSTGHFNPNILDHMKKLNNNEIVGSLRFCSPWFWSSYVICRSSGGQ